MEKNHHVAWADRIGLNKQWARDVQACGAVFGNELYPDAVRRFRCNIPNIKNGPQLRDEIDEYESQELKTWKKEALQWLIDNNQSEANNPEWLRRSKEDIEQKSHEHMYMYIIQLIEDNGFCFYESNIEGDDVGLDD